MKLQADRPTVRAAGGTRYVVVSLGAAPPPPEMDTVLVVDRSHSLSASRKLLDAVVTELLEQAAPVGAVAFNEAPRVVAPQEIRRVAFAKGSALAEAWIRGCLIIADEVSPKPGHCILVTDGHPTVGPTDAAALVEQAEGIWIHTGIATSAIALGSQPELSLLNDVAWRGGGTCTRIMAAGQVRVTPPEPRRVLEMRTSPGVDVQVLSRTRSQQYQDGVLSLGVSGLSRVIVALTFRGQEEPFVEARVRPGTWHKLTFDIGPARGPKDEAVMRLVGEELERIQHQSRPTPILTPRTESTAEGAASLVARFVPTRAAWPRALPSSYSVETLRDLCRGSMLWGAVGSALGKGLVGLDPATIRARYGPHGVSQYEAWLPDAPDSAGMVSGDIQMVREVAETVVEAGGRFYPEAFALRLVGLLHNNRGIGNACDSAARAMLEGVPWWKAGLAVDSAGNGAALRVAPVGLAWCLHPNLLFLYRDAVISALPTHTHPLGVAAAVVMASAVAWCVRERLRGVTSIDAPALLHFLADLIDPLEEEAMPERRQKGARTRLCERIRQIESLLAMSPQEALMVTWNGSYALESIPAALYCFLHSTNPRTALIAAVNGGFDADTVGCMTGHLIGAWCGASRLHQEAEGWWTGLEWRDTLEGLADALADLAVANRTGT